MCFCLYLGTSKPPPFIPHQGPPGSGRICTEVLPENSLGVHGKFTLPCVTFVGADGGCGCGFRHNEAAIYDPDYDTSETQPNHESLVAFLSEHCRQEPFVELYGCWVGDHEQGAQVRQDVDLTLLTVPTFHFKMKGYLKVWMPRPDAGPGDAIVGSGKTAEPPARDRAMANALRSLEGLSTGDAFGSLFFGMVPTQGSHIQLPAGTWFWTDDTHMALSVVEVLRMFGKMDQDALARAFARRFLDDPTRGYARGAMQLLRQISEGRDWRELSPQLFGGGSYGNGAAMRIAPLGAYYCGEPERAANEAALSAVVTHAHPEGRAGAVAVAVAACLAASRPLPTGNDFLKAVAQWVPESITKAGILQSMGIPAEDLAQAAMSLGTGQKVSAQDTVPFCLWNAAHHLHDFEAALWSSARGMGDCDTTCAIVGGIVALSAPEIPAAWLRFREPLPAGFEPLPT